MYLVELLCDLWIETNRVANVVRHASGRVNHYLRQVGHTSDSSIFDLMQFVPEIFLDFIHIAPQVHPISFYVSYLFLVCSLFIFITINILWQIGILRSLDDHRGHLLWRFYFLDLLLEPLLDDLWNGHIVNFRGSLDLSSRHQGLIWCHSAVGCSGSSRLALLLVILLDVQGVHLLPKLLVTRAQIRLQEGVVLQLRLWLLLFLLSDLLGSRYLGQYNLWSL